eukprot:357157-Chlamydomonas_euryale.AAC.1
MQKARHSPWQKHGEGSGDTIHWQKAEQAKTQESQSFSPSLVKPWVKATELDTLPTAPQLHSGPCPRPQIATQPKTQLRSRFDRRRTCRAM